MLCTDVYFVKIRGSRSLFSRDTFYRDIKRLPIISGSHVIDVVALV
jgi:hypothetical protein